MQAFMIGAPASEPVTLEEAKAWLRVDSVDENATILGLIAAARGAVEQATGRALVTQSWRIVLDAWPQPSHGLCVVALPIGPTQSVSAMRVFDVAGVAQIVAPAAYELVGAADSARVLLSTARPAPGRPFAGIEIDCVVGYGAPAATPAPLRQAILDIVAERFEHRGDARAESLLSPETRARLHPYRRARLA